MGPDPGKPGEASDAVRTTCLSLIQEVVMQLAIAIDPAAIIPSLADEVALTGIRPSALAQGGLQPSVETAGLDA
tara:strand:- start:313 stop:534 length:222 start_codon:yes stop_codon:yes gene_type:complete